MSGDVKEAAPGREAVRVLLVEDTPMIRTLMAQAFHNTGRYRVVAEAADGGEGIEAAREHQPDLVMLDLQMKPVDGFTALPQIHALLPEARIVVFTGYDEVMHRDELVAAGATDAIGKGTKLVEVIARVDELF